MLQDGRYLQQEDVVSILSVQEFRVAVVLLDLKRLPAFLPPLDCVGSEDDSQRFVSGKTEHSACRELSPVFPGRAGTSPGTRPGETVFKNKSDGSEELCQGAELPRGTRLSLLDHPCRRRHPDRGSATVVLVLHGHSENLHKALSRRHHPVWGHQEAPAEMVVLSLQIGHVGCGVGLGFASARLPTPGVTCNGRDRGRGAGGHGAVWDPSSPARSSSTYWLRPRVVSPAGGTAGASAGAASCGSGGSLGGEAAAGVSSCSQQGFIA